MKNENEGLALREGGFLTFYLPENKEESAVVIKNHTEGNPKSIFLLNSL